MGEPYLIQIVRDGKENSGRLSDHTFEELFGKAVTTHRFGGYLRDDEELIGRILLSQVEFQKLSPKEGSYSVWGKLRLPLGWEAYSSYLEGIAAFSGTVSCTEKTEQCYEIDFQLAAPVSRQFHFEKADFTGGALSRVSHAALEDNQTFLRLEGHWQGSGDKTDSSSARAELECRVKLSGVGDVALLHRLFRGNVWDFHAAFLPHLSLEKIGDFIDRLVGVQGIGSAIVLPEGMSGLDLFGVKELRFSLSPPLLLQGIEIVLANSRPWNPGVPFFSVEETGVSLSFNLPAAQWTEESEVTVAVGIFGTFLISPKQDFRLKLGMWCDFPGLIISGELLAQQDKKFKNIALAEILNTYDVPSTDVDRLAVAHIRYVASPVARSFAVEFQADTKEILQFSILGLSIAITEISGEFSYEPDALFLRLHGEIKVGRQNPFLLGLTFDYDCAQESRWHFLGELTAGEASIASLLSELLLLADMRDEAVFDLKITELAVEFYSGGSGSFSIRATLEQPWNTKLLGVNLALFGRVDLTKKNTGEISGTLEAGVRLNAFQIKVFYELVEDARYGFQIWYEKAYLDAVYEQRQGHEILSLGLKGMTLYQLVSGFVHMVNPNADFKLSSPWDILDRIHLDAFTLEFDLKERMVSMLYDADLDILGLVRIRQIGIRYSRKDTAKVEFVLVGNVLEKEYTLGSPLVWDAIDDNPPETGSSDSKLIKISYLGLGQHFGTESLLAAQGIAEAVEALKKAIQPVKTGDRPVLAYAEGVNWLFGADMTYKGMLRIQMVLNDPSLYGVLVTVKQGDDNALSQLSGLSLELLYRKVTDEIGMFSAELTIPDRFKVFRLGVLQVTLGRFYMEVYTNGNFFLDLGFPHKQDFSPCFVIEAGYYTGRGGFYFGVLSQETNREIPKIVNGRFEPVITVGIGLSLGVGRSFDFSVVKGSVSLEFFAIFEGIFAVYTPLDNDQKKDFFYRVKAVAGISGRLFLSVDFVILSISATAEVKAYAAVMLEAYQPILFEVELDLKVGASIKILFIKISFSFHFSMHMEFAIGEASKTPWKLAGAEATGRIERGYSPYRFHQLVGDVQKDRHLRLKKTGCYTGEKEELSVRILPLYTVLQPSLQPCAAFLLLLNQDETGFGKVIKIAEEWILNQLDETASLTVLKEFSALLRQGNDFVRYFKERTRLVTQPCPADIAGERQLDGVFFPAVPGLVFQWETYASDGKLVDEESISFAERPMVNEEYVKRLKEYFERLNPEPGAGEQGADGIHANNWGSAYCWDVEKTALSAVLLEDYLSVVLKAVVKEVEDRLRKVSVNTEGRSLRDIASQWESVTVPFQKRQGETCASAANFLGMDEKALLWKNHGLEQLDSIEDGQWLMLEVGVTPQSILLDNPQWRFCADAITVGGQMYQVGGMSVEQVVNSRRIPLSALAEAIENDRNALEMDRIVLRSVPFFGRDTLCSILRSQETMKQAAGMVSRFFLQGLRLPYPEGDEQHRQADDFLNYKENWAGLYQILGQQKELRYERGAGEDFLRHRLTVTAAAGYEDWIYVGEGCNVPVSNEDIVRNAPQAVLSHIFESPLGEIPPYVLEKKQHPFEECHLYFVGQQRRSILTFTKDFLVSSYGHLRDYQWNVDSMHTGFGSAMGRNAGTQMRDGSFGLLLSLIVRKMEEGLPVYEVEVKEKGSSSRLHDILKGRATHMELLYEPSSVQNMEAGLYPVPLEKESTRIVMTNLSRETKKERNGPGNLEGKAEGRYIASFADIPAFLDLLWQQSVTDKKGCYLCLHAEEEFSPSLFSSSAEGKLWLLVTEAEAGSGCNCVIDGQEVYESQYAWLALSDEYGEGHPEEYTVKSILNPGSAGFELALLQPENPESSKADAVRNLYSIVNYSIHGERYEVCHTGMPLIPLEGGEGKSPVWQYSQSVPLDRFLTDSSGNPYEDTGIPAQIRLEFRDVLGNAAETPAEDTTASDKEWITITPRSNDPLLAIHQTGVISTGYMVREGKLVLFLEPALKGCLGSEKRKAAADAVKKSIRQIEAKGVGLSLESTLLPEPVALSCDDLLDMYRKISGWLAWTEGMTAAKCQKETLETAAEAYAVTPEELLRDNMELPLCQLFGETELVRPVMKIFRRGDCLAELNPEVGWEKNWDAALCTGTEVTVAEGEGRNWAVTPVMRTFALNAAGIGCHISSLVEANIYKTGIISENYVFGFQGYEVEAGAEDGVTASLADICAVFRDEYDVEVTPMELVAEEEQDILKEGASLWYRKLTVREGQTLSQNHMGCTAGELWARNRDTRDLFADGASVWCTSAPIEAGAAGSLQRMCDTYGITPERFYRANKAVTLCRPGLLCISSHMICPESAYDQSFVTEENGGTGYSLTGLCEKYHCQKGVWFYRMLQGILIEGRQITAGNGTVTVSGVDTLDSVGRKLSLLAEDAEELLLRSVIIRDGIVLPLLPSGMTYKESVDGMWLRKRNDVLLRLETKLHLYRNGEGQTETPEGIYHGRTTAVPGDGTEEGCQLDNFVSHLEKELPFAYAVQGTEDEGTSSGLCLWMAKGGGGYGIGHICVSPTACYDDKLKTPAFYALAPITTKLVSREQVGIAPLLEDGSLGPSEPGRFTGIDAERWAGMFLEDVERMLCPQMVSKACSTDCEGWMNQLLQTKELLAQKLPARLCHVLQPRASEGHPDTAGLPQAKQAFAEQFRASLSQAYGKNVLLQYSGTAELAEEMGSGYDLTGALAMNGFDAPVSLKAGKLHLEKGAVYLHVFAEAARLRNASFSVEDMEYRISQLESSPREEGDAYRQSAWFSFIKPVGKQRYGENLSFDLTSALPVPVPLRLYPKQPVLKEHRIVTQKMEEAGSLAQLLCFDYSAEFTHEMAGQDMVYMTMVFNEKPRDYRRSMQRDVFDCLAQYISVRDGLAEMLYQDSACFKRAYQTMVELAYETALYWEEYEEAAAQAVLQEKTYECHFRTWYTGGVFQVDFITDEERMPDVHFVLGDGTYAEMKAEKTETGCRYELEHISEEALLAGVTLRLTLRGLSIFQYQSAYTKIHINRNEALSDAAHPVNERFLYRTDISEFASRLHALVSREEDVSVEIPKKFEKEAGFTERAVRYLFEETLKMGVQKEAQLSCQVSYGYAVSETAGSQYVELPVCLQTRRTYDIGWRQEVAGMIEKWKEKHQPPERGRYLRVSVTIYSTELQEQGLPVVRLGGVRIYE